MEKHDTSLIPRFPLLIFLSIHFQDLYQGLSRLFFFYSFLCDKEKSIISQSIFYGIEKFFFDLPQDCNLFLKYWKM